MLISYDTSIENIRYVAYADASKIEINNNLRLRMELVLKKYIKQGNVVEVSLDAANGVIRGEVYRKRFKSREAAERGYNRLKAAVEKGNYELEISGRGKITLRLVNEDV